MAVGAVQTCRVAGIDRGDARAQGKTSPAPREKTPMGVDGEFACPAQTTG